MTVSAHDPRGAGTTHAPVSLSPRRGAAHLLAVALVAASALLGSATAASATVGDPGGTPTLTADPISIAVGATSAITAEGLGELATAGFGLGQTAGGTFVESGTTTYSAPVSQGTAHATFTASVAGTFTVAVGNGETALATVVVTVLAPPPPPQPTIDVRAAASTIAAGENTVITATGLGGLGTAIFGLGGPGTGGSFGTDGATTVRVPVSGGTASTTFTADRPGTFTIAVGTGETVLSSTTVTVTAASPSPTPTPTASPTPTPAPVPISAGVSWWIWLLLALIVVAILAAGAVLWAILARRRSKAG